MNPNRTSPPNESAFYASSAQRAESWKVRSSARLTRGGMSKHFQVWLGFVPCRNALVSKPSSTTEGNDVTAELPDAGAPLVFALCGLRGAGVPVTQSIAWIHRSRSSQAAEGTP